MRVNVDQVLGRDPLSLLLFRYRMVNWVRVLQELGITPVRELDAKYLQFLPVLIIHTCSDLCVRQVCI